MTAATKTRLKIRTRRVYEPPSRDDGLRVLVDRLWPRGVSKERANIDLWLRDLGPSDGLRKWFGHDPARWEQFKLRYFRELDGNGELLGQMLDAARGRTVTLVYGARDQEHNQAVALKEYLARPESA